MMIVRNTINKGSLILKKNSINSNLLDAELILSNIMGVNRETLITNDSINISKEILNNSSKDKLDDDLTVLIIGK